MSMVAAVIEERLKLRDNFILDINNIAGLANEIVDFAFNENPRIFSGKFLPFPHKVSSAAFALSLALKRYSHEDPRFFCSLLVLNDIFNALEQDSIFFKFSKIDLNLILEAQKTSTEIISQSDIGV